MLLRDELRLSILAKIKRNIDPLDGFFTNTETKEAILAVIISGRHLLLEGPPGTGKTTLSKILAAHLPSMKVVNGCRFNCDPKHPQCPDCLSGKTGQSVITVPGSHRFVRVQGSPELMPEDLLGDIDPVIAMQCGIQDLRAFTPGKIQRAHRKILFIDELNRVPERTQNTLIEVLEEKSTTIAGFDITIAVDTIVIATQNPEEFTGADRVSETLGDRFERVRIDYPNVDQEIAILKRYAKITRGMKLDDKLVNKIVKISHATRDSKEFSKPASVRASISILEQSQAIAQLNGRDTVNSTDIEKASKISLQGRTELAPGSKYYEKPEIVYQNIIHDLRD